MDLEDWLTRHHWIVANNPETDWQGLVEATGDKWVKEYVPQSGILFDYTRFSNLYRCPEFERADDPRKTQSTFNITRSILGRKWWVPQLDPDTPQDLADRSQMLGVMGAILSVSAIHAPGRLEMMVDESWKYNVGDGNGEYPRNGGAWMRSDAVWCTWSLACVRP